MEEPRAVPPELVLALEPFPKLEDDLLCLWCDVMRAYGGALYPLDMFVQGAVKRTLCQARAVRQLLEACNLMCARAILRMQIDTAMRIHAAWLVPDPHAFAAMVLAGKRIDKMADRRGNRLTDSFLAKDLSSQHEWVHRVYEHTSGYVHLSESQFYMSLTAAEETGRFQALVAADDRHMPVESFVEVAECFKEATGIVFHYIEGWRFTKDNPKAVAEYRKRLEIRGE